MQKMSSLSQKPCKSTSSLLNPIGIFTIIPLKTILVPLMLYRILIIPLNKYYGLSIKSYGKMRNFHRNHVKTQLALQSFHKKPVLMQQFYEFSKAFY